MRPKTRTYQFQYYAAKEKDTKDQFHPLYAAVDLDSELSALSSLLQWINHLISVGCKLPCAANGGEYDSVVQGAKCVEC